MKKNNVSLISNDAAYAMTFSTYLPMNLAISGTLAFAASVAVVMRHSFDGAGLTFLCSCLRFRVWVWFH